MSVSVTIFSVVDLLPRTVSHEGLKLSLEHAESRWVCNITWAYCSNNLVRHTGMGQLSDVLWSLCRGMSVTSASTKRANHAFKQLLAASRASLNCSTRRRMAQCLAAR